MRLLGFMVLSAVLPASVSACPDMYKHTMRELHSQKTVDLCDLVGDRPTLIINTASHCGFTPQFKGLESIHQRYADKGLVVIGFSSDDFHQEASSEEKAEEVCRVKFGVSFTMLAPTSVKGNSANPIFDELGRQAREPTWNFNKYLVDGSGQVVGYYGSRTSPQSSKLIGDIEKLLGSQ